MENKKTTIISLVVVVLTVAALWFTNRAVTPRELTLNEVKAEAKEWGYKLLTTEELAERLKQDPNGILLVDTRQEWEYRTGHLKGASNFPMEPTWWSRWKKAGPLATFIGPNKERPLVFY